MNIIASLAIAFLSGLVFTFLARSFARQFGIVNKPTGLVPQHTKPIAYLGGLGIYLGLLVACLIQHFLYTTPIPYWFLLLGFLYLTMGVMDDLMVMRPLTKFAFQVVLASLAVWAGVIFPFTGMMIVDYGLSAFWILVLVNAFNLTDVCDGLVGGLSVVVFLSISFFIGSASIIPLLVAGSILGFLVYNSPLASIFMGDAGSHLLGFWAAYFTLTSMTANGIILGFLPVAILTGVFLFELTFLIIVRYRKGLKWWLGSPDHFSLRLQALSLIHI